MSGGPVDFDYLESYAGGDRQVIAEVLALFQGQAEIWAAKLADPGDGWRDLSHTIKGAARGIGAVALGEVADRAETGDPSMAPEVRDALGEVLAAIQSYVSIKR
jgi:HPt (histidine-containing phosphotransfer) domain-containing protein